MRALTFVEVDIEWCSLDYGATNAAGTCPAVLGVDSPHKCFNTSGTCPVRLSFVSEPVTLRFAESTGYLIESGIDAIACIDSISFTPGTISLGENLGTRSSLRVTMSDFPWSDTGPGYDKYVSERGYDPFSQGTFWGKFRARHPALRGRPIRVIRGLLGQAREEMEIRHYVIDSVEGPGPDGRYSFTAKDVLKLLDGDRAQAPRMSNGYLFGNINDSTTTATLAPVGIGNIEYPASGFVAIGGKEICSFTRSGDTLTLVRGLYNTEAVAHKASDRVQICIEYMSQDVSAVLRDLMVNYAAVPPEYIDIEEWQDETRFFLRTLYTSLIAEPVAVETLCNELIRQGALALWWDDVASKIRLRVLRPIGTEAALFDESVISKDSLSISDQPNKRLSQVWVYYAQVNPLKNVDDTDNYRSCAVVANLERETEYGSPAIDKIYSRWIPEGGRAIATRIGDILVGRFSRPPRKFKLNAFRHGPVLPLAGIGCRVSAWPLQDAMGQRIEVPAQVVRINPKSDYFETEMEEFDFTFLDDGDPTIIFEIDTFNVNARQVYDYFYPPPEEGDDVYIVVERGVKVGSESTNLPAMDIGTWPAGVNLHLILRGRIQGMGGRGGGTANNTPSPGFPGGTALYLRHPLTVEYDDGEIYGGGGGGGAARYEQFGSIVSAGGGGGAGFNPGTGGRRNGNAGTTEAGGSGGSGPGSINGGRGGNPGNAGQSRSGTTWANPGGQPGPAIDGASFITASGTSDIRGPQVN